MVALTDRKKHFKKALRNAMNGKVVKLERNEMFNVFAEELTNYFNTHLMPCKVEVIEGTKYYTINDQVKTSDCVIKIWDPEICNITLIPNPKGIELYRLEMYKVGNGLGSLFMNAINEVSMKTGIVVYLIPGDPGIETYYKTYYKEHQQHWQDYFNQLNMMVENWNEVMNNDELQFHFMANVYVLTTMNKLQNDEYNGLLFMYKM